MKFRTKEEIMKEILLGIKLAKDYNSCRIVEVLVDIRDILAAELSLKLNAESQIEHIGLCPYCKEPGIDISTLDDKRTQYLCCNKDCSHPNYKWEGEERE